MGKERDDGSIRLVMMTWRDAWRSSSASFSFEGGLQGVEAVEYTIHSVGWLIGEEDGYYLIGSDLHQEGNGFLNRILAVPKAWVEEIVDLDVKKESRKKGERVKNASNK